MNKVNISNLSHEEFLAQRGLGSSDSATICGKNPYKTKYELYAEKKGMVGSFSGNSKTYWGKVLEEIIAKEAYKLLLQADGNLKLEANEFIYKLEDCDFITATPDYWIMSEKNDPILLEIKNTGEYSRKDWQDNVPLIYYYQVQHQLLVTKANKAYIAALVGGNDLIIKEIKSDEEVQKEILEACIDFDSRIRNNLPPEFQAGDSDLLNKIYKEDKEITEIQLTDISMALEIKLIDEQIKELENQKEGLICKIKLEMGGAQKADNEVLSITWKAQKRESLDTKRIKDEAPELYDVAIAASLAPVKSMFLTVTLSLVFTSISLFVVDSLTV